MDTRTEMTGSTDPQKRTGRKVQINFPADSFSFLRNYIVQVFSIRCAVRFPFTVLSKL